MNRSDDDKHLLLATLAVIVLVVAVAGISYTLFSFSPAAGGANTVNTGTITMSYSEPSNGINIANALPTIDSVGQEMNADGQYFEFTVSTNASGNISIPYEINITPENPDSGKTGLANSQVKIYLTTSETSGGEETAVTGFPKLISELATSTIRTGGSLVLLSTSDNHTVSDSSNTTISYYTVRIWIDSSVDVADISANDYQYKLKVNVDSSIGALTTSTP